MICQERAVTLHEVEQIRHLLQIRRDVGIVAREMYVVELQIEDVLDIAIGSQLATGRGCGRRCDLRRREICRRRKHTGGRNRDRAESRYHGFPFQSLVRGPLPSTAQKP